MLYSAIHVGSRWKIQDRRQIKNTDNLETKHSQEKQTRQNTAKQNYPGLVAFYGTQPVNELGLLYNVREPTWGYLVRENYGCSADIMYTVQSITLCTLFTH